MNKPLINALKTFRAGYAHDVKMFGENYWKEKVLSKFGSLKENEYEWSDYYKTEIAEPLDSLSSILDLAKVVLDETIDWDA